MKKIILIILILFISSTVFAYTNATELAKKEGNVESIAKWIINNIQYKVEEGTDHWQKSKETLRLGTGDCEDFAILFCEAIKYYGYEPKIFVIVITRTQGHAICVFYNRNGYAQIFDTMGLHEQWGQDINNLVKCSYLGCQYFYEVDSPYEP
jgi:predicted transglutaminase-like cysteine proteinase